MVIQIQDALKYNVISGTTHATPGTQTTHAHGLKVVPDYYFIIPTSNGGIYESAVADATNIYVKGSATVLTFKAVCFSRNLQSGRV